jgi:hypothetical protein
MQELSGCKEKISEYLTDSGIEIGIDELDDCMIQLISCWCQSGVEACAIASTLTLISLRLRIISYLKKKYGSNITEALIKKIEDKIRTGESLPKACELVMTESNSPSSRKPKGP